MSTIAEQAAAMRLAVEADLAEVRARAREELLEDARPRAGVELRVRELAREVGALERWIDAAAKAISGTLPATRYTTAAIDLVACARLAVYREHGGAILDLRDELEIAATRERRRAREHAARARLEAAREVTIEALLEEEVAEFAAAEDERAAALELLDVAQVAIRGLECALARGLFDEPETGNPTHPDRY